MENIRGSVISVIALTINGSIPSFINICCFENHISPAVKNFHSISIFRMLTGNYWFENIVYSICIGRKTIWDINKEQIINYNRFTSRISTFKIIFHVLCNQICSGESINMTWELNICISTISKSPIPRSCTNR